MDVNGSDVTRDKVTGVVVVCIMYALSCAQCFTGKTTVRHSLLGCLYTVYYPC